MAAVLLVLDAVRNVSLLAAVAAGVDIPAAVVISQVALGVVELAVAAGVWGLHHWARTGALTVAALSLVLAAVGVVNAPSAGGKTVEAVGVLLCLGVLAVSLHPDTPRAYP
ncbi:hypothetical protein RHODO2019_04870 [Rhodococcus antarcticus]|uniref:DoxX-like protein n=1 Tax=Rhodococcus antarcticus TaxID=2987751 RepID=A0ABY6P3T3_9NOCA|nr:hypothetical protein [Rhodococcus antarcticus]UZJ25778.1 hypothetical protein RHODO2019_04870 [Rhodococcus antarcticus]